MAYSTRTEQYSRCAYGSLEAEESGSTRVEVTARTSAVTWDKEYARPVIEKITDEAS